MSLALSWVTLVHMKVIIAGSRSILNWDVVAQAIQSAPFKITEVVSGGAQGVDYLGECLAELHGMAVKQFPADWRAHGKAAGPIRNKQMAQYADGLIAIWDGDSRGTANMIHEMEKLKKPVHIVKYCPED